MFIIISNITRKYDLEAQLDAAHPNGAGRDEDDLSNSSGNNNNNNSNRKHS